MPLADRSFGWQEAILALGAIALAAFLVTWVVTDLLKVARTAYVAILSAVVAVLAATYVTWSGSSLRELVVDGWAWGIGAGVVAGAIVAPMIRRLPSREHAHGSALGGSLAWEALVYGVAEGLLLATMPTLAAWQAAERLGWTDTTWTRIGSGALAVTGALVVILVHHLGYAEFRRRAGRKMLAGALVTCGLQGLAFLVTGNVLAPIVAHVVLHAELVFRGVEMPPTESTGERQADREALRHAA